MTIDYKVSIAFLITLLISGCQKSMNNPLIKTQCRFDAFIEDPNVPQIAKDIFLGNDFNLNNDEEALGLLDSLGSENKNTRKFYFKVLLNSSSKADGYFSEGLGETVKDYIELETEEFASHFDDRACFGDNHLETASDLVLDEFKILSENDYEESIVKDYIRILKDNCRECSTSQIVTVEKFIGMLKN